MKKTLFLLVITLLISPSNSPVHAATVGPVDGATTLVSATVGNPIQPPPDDNQRFAVYGNTSPNAVVKIQSPIYGETKANSVGAFEFKYLFLTLFREDLCVVSYDTAGRTTPPLCIPPPTTQANKRVGPVILPPSTSISAGNAYIGDTVTLTGQTIPNADVKLSLFTDDAQKNKKLTLIPEAYAYTIPQMSLTSNAKGEYSIILPTTSSQFLRMFSRAIIDGQSTPKSLTLVLDIFPVWMILLRFFANFFSILLSHWLEIVILSQLYFLFMYLLRRFFNPHAISTHRHRELALIYGDLTISQHEMALYTESRLAVRNVGLSFLPKDLLVKR